MTPPSNKDDETMTGLQLSMSERRKRPDCRQAFLVIVAGGLMGERIPIAKDRTTIGRLQGLEVSIEDTLMSRKHAEIVRREDGITMLHDLGSKNGTFCNDQRCSERELQDGDLIRVGESILKYVGPNSIEQGYLKQLSERAQRDGLTGFFNKETFFTCLERNLSRCRDLHEPLSVAMMDLDWFKKINDSWGHPAGDYVLREFAGLIKSSVRPADFLARYGGEEFGLILPHTNIRGATVVGERIRNCTAGHPFEFNGQKLKVTVSIGITEWSDGDGDFHALIGRADKALYEAKEKGRNQTCTIVETP